MILRVILGTAFRGKEVERENKGCSTSNEADRNAHGILTGPSPENGDF